MVYAERIRLFYDEKWNPPGWRAMCDYTNREILEVGRFHAGVDVRKDFIAWVRERDPDARMFWTTSTFVVCFRDENVAMEFRLRYDVEMVSACEVERRGR